MLDIYIIKKTFVYMFPIASQTAGPNGLNFFEETLKSNLNFPLATPGTSASF